VATGEAGHLAATKIVVADTRLRLGDVEGGWNALGDAIAAMPRIASARRRYVILLNLGMWLADSDMPYGAVRVLTSARDTALQTRQVLRVAESSLYLAKANARIGFLDVARDNLEAARPDPERNGRWGRSERAQYEYLAGVAEVERNARPAIAIQAATDALAFFNGRQYAERVAPLHLVRGRAHAAAGELADAEADFASGIVTYRGYRDSLPSTRQRMLSQQVVWDLYEERLQLVARRSPSAAFDVAEDGRSRTLLESLRQEQEREDSVRPETLQRELGPGTRVLYYAVLPKELLIWAIGRDEIVFRRVPIDRQLFEQRVTGLGDALRRDAPARDWWPAAEQAYDLLIAPVGGAIAAGTQLIVVPDGALHRLPFAARRDHRSQRYLLESHAITVAPKRDGAPSAAPGQAAWCVAAAPLRCCRPDQRRSPAVARWRAGGGPFDRADVRTQRRDCPRSRHEDGLFPVGAISGCRALRGTRRGPSGLPPPGIARICRRAHRGRLGGARSGGHCRDALRPHASRRAGRLQHRHRTGPSRRGGHHARATVPDCRRAHGRRRVVGYRRRRVRYVARRIS